MQEHIEELYDFSATVHDIRKKIDPNRNLIDKFAEDADGATTPDTAEVLLAGADHDTKYVVGYGATLLVGSIDVESDVESIVYLKKSIATTVTIVRQFKLASKGHLHIDFPNPFSFEGTADGTSTETFVELWYAQPSAGRISAGYNGRLIES